MLKRYGWAVSALFLAACAGHPLDCSMGIAHGDCAYGTPGFYNGPGRAEADADECASYGFTVGSDGYAQCRLRLTELHAQSDQARRAAIIAALQQQAAATSTAINQEAADLRAAAQGARSNATNCTTTYVGGTAYTHCQ